MAITPLGHRVGIIDADFALGNVDVMLGLTPEEHLGAVSARTVSDVALNGVRRA